MAKFQTEGPVSVNNFINFVNDNTAQLRGSSLKNSFDSAKLGGTFLPQGDFVAPHALSESYGAEAGFRFWVNNDAAGIPNYSSSRAQTFDGHFYSEFKWAMEVGNVEHSMVFPYRNYIYDISQTSTTNGCFGSGDQTYRKIDCKLYHSNVDKQSRDRISYFDGIASDNRVVENIESQYDGVATAFGNTISIYSSNWLVYIADVEEGDQLIVRYTSATNDHNYLPYTVTSTDIDSYEYPPGNYVYIKKIYVDGDIRYTGTGSSSANIYKITQDGAHVAIADDYQDANISGSSQDYSYILDPWVTYRAKTYHSDHFDQMIFPQESAFQKSGAQYLTVNSVAGEGFYSSLDGWGTSAYFGYPVNGYYRQQIVGRYPVISTYPYLQIFWVPFYAPVYTYLHPTAQGSGATQWWYYVSEEKSTNSVAHPSARGLYEKIAFAVPSWEYAPQAPYAYPWVWPSFSGSKKPTVGITEEYYYLDELYNIIHNEDIWRRGFLNLLNDWHANIFGNYHDFFRRKNARNSNPGDLGKGSIDNSRLRLIDPGSSITDQSGKVMMIDDGDAQFNKTTSSGAMGKTFDHWNGCDWQLFMTRLSEYPEKVPVYLRAGDHGHGYIEVTPESTLRYHIEKVGSVYQILEESSFVLSDGPWESTSILGGIKLNPPEGWYSTWNEEFQDWQARITIINTSGSQNQYDTSGSILEINNYETDYSNFSNVFFTNVAVIPGVETIFYIELFTLNTKALIYINDVLFLEIPDSGGSSRDTMTLSFIPNDYNLKLSICPASPYNSEDTPLVQLLSVKMAQKGAVLPEQYFTKSEAIEAWSKLHYNEHDYYYNNSYNSSERVSSDISWNTVTKFELLVNNIWTSGGYFFELDNFQVSSSFSASSKTQFEMLFYINKTDGRKAIARKSIAVYPSAPAKLPSSGEEDVFRGVADVFRLNGECQMVDGTTSSVNAVPYSSVNSTAVSTINLGVAHDGFYTSDDIQCEYYYSNDLKNWSNAFDSVDLNTDAGGLISINFGDPAFPSYPTNLTDQYIYYRARWIAGPNSTQNYPGTIIAEDILEFGSIADNNRITVLHNNNFHYYRTNKDFFPVAGDGQTPVSNLTDSEGKVYVFEGLRFLEPNVQNVTSVIFPEANTVDFNWEVTYPSTPGKNLENLVNSNLDSDWNNVKKPNKRIHQSAWQFIHNLRVDSDNNTGHNWSGPGIDSYPGMSGNEVYSLGDKRGPFSKYAKSAISFLRFEALRRSITEYAVRPELKNTELRILFKRSVSSSNIGAPDSSGQDSNDWFEELPIDKFISGSVSISPSSTSGSYWIATGTNTSFKREILGIPSSVPDSDLPSFPYTIPSGSDFTIKIAGIPYIIQEITNDSQLLLKTQVQVAYNNATTRTPYNENEMQDFLNQDIFCIFGIKSGNSQSFSWRNPILVGSAAVTWQSGETLPSGINVGDVKPLAVTRSIAAYYIDSSQPATPIGSYDFTDVNSPINITSSNWDLIPGTIIQPEDKIWICMGVAYSEDGTDNNSSINFNIGNSSGAANVYESSALDPSLENTNAAGSAQIGSIFGPVYQNIKYLPKSTEGLKLNIHYLIDLPMADRLQVEMAARFWESIILDDIEMDVVVMPHPTRSVGGTLASATPSEYTIGEDSAFHAQNRAQIKEIYVYLDTDDIIPGAAPDSSYTATGREIVLDGVVPGGNRLCHILIHEIAHGLGVGTNWNVEFVGYYDDQYQWGFANEFGSQYNGPEAVSQYKSIVNSATHVMLYSNQTKKIEKTSITSSMRSNFYTNSVPIEGGSFAQEFQSWQDGDVAGGHIAEYAKKAGGRTQPTFVELMSPTYDVANSPITRLTIGYLADLGYQVDYNQAQSIGKPAMTTQSSGEQILIGYTGTEYYKWIFYNPGGDADNFGGFTAQQRAEYGMDPNSTEDSLSGVHLFLSQIYEEVKDRLTAPKLVSCNCKTHKINATKNPIMPYGISE